MAVLYVAGSRDSALLAIGGLLLTLQIIIWIESLQSRFGPRSIAALVALVLVLVVLAPRVFRAFHNRHFRIEAIIELTQAYPSGRLDGTLLAVSPDEKWLLYVLDPPNRGPERLPPPIVLRDLRERSERTVDFAAVPRRGSDTHGGVFEVIRGLKAACWTSEHVVVGDVRIELSTASARTNHAQEQECDASQPNTIRLSTRTLRTLGDWSSEGILERSRPDGGAEIVHTRREIAARWSIHDASTSPDGRFVAYRGSRELLVVVFLTLMLPGDSSRQYLFVFDLETGSEHMIAKVDAGSFVWGSGSRSLYFVDQRTQNISVVRIGVP